jgi:hypothetical protein
MKFNNKAGKAYINGNILTVDGKNNRVQAVAVNETKIIAVGSNDEIYKYVDTNTEIIDLEQRTMLPGFIDAHSHFYQAGLRTVTEANLYSPPIGTIRNINDIKTALLDWSVSAPSGQLIKGFGYDDTALEERRCLTRYDLDLVSTEQPIIIRHISGHLHSFNSKALELAGIFEDTPDPEDGVYCKDISTGEHNGVVEEALDMVNKILAKITCEQEKQAVAKANELYSIVGVTTASTGTTRSVNEVDLIRCGQKDGSVKLRVILNRSVSVLEELKDYEYDDILMKGSVKTFQDGSIKVFTGFLNEPYNVSLKGNSNYRGYPIRPSKELTALVKKIHNEGEQVFIHGNGDEAIEQILDAFEEAQKNNQRSDPRHVVIHAQMAREDQLDRMKKLEVLPSFFILHTHYWGDMHRDVYLGPERALRMNPCNSALERDIIFTIHCDTPVVPQEPLKAIWSAVNRISTGGDIIGDDQRIPVDEAIRAYTYNSAYQYRLEDKLGSIEEGKLADFVILSEDPTSCDPIKIKDIEVVETIVGGKSIYRKKY